MMSDNKPLNVQAAAEYLDISKPQLYKLTSKNKLTYYKPGGKRLYFYKADLDEYIKSGRVATN